MKNALDSKKAVLGLSGGVDSAVAAYLLTNDGYDVSCVYLKNWTEADERGICPALRDREDAMRVAAKLGLPFRTVDYEKEYRERVFAPFLEGLGAGVNPNPDILCNPLVKFEALLAVADELGAAWIATGHYARKTDGRLAAGSDLDKDQSYFLSRIRPEQLARTLFPVGGLRKTEVRALARRLELPVSDKEGTSGICFIGERNIEEFLKDKVPNQPGPIVSVDGQRLGEHRGLPFYTIGQRHGFGGGGGEPYYVVAKDLVTNTLTVAKAYAPELFRREVVVTDPYWISGMPELPLECQARLRYRQPLQSCKVEEAASPGSLIVVFESPQKAVTPGQYAAFYKDEICLGSAVIA
jgi:tRNA-specific 2-thiouridylase